MLALSIQAQESEKSNNNSVADRPAETDLLLEDPISPDPAQVAPEVQDLPGLTFGDFIRMFLVLGFVIALVYGFFWLLKRFSGIKAEGEEAIRIVATRPLKGDAAIHLIQTASRFFLIGSSGSAINLLAEIDDKESIDEILLAASSPKSPIGFAGLIKERFGSLSQSSEPSQAKDPAEYLRQQKDRLKDL